MKLVVVCPCDVRAVLMNVLAVSQDPEGWRRAEARRISKARRTVTQRPNRREERPLPRKEEIRIAEATKRGAAKTSSAAFVTGTSGGD